MLALHAADPDRLRTKLRPDILMLKLQEYEKSIYQKAASSTIHSVLPSSVIEPQLGNGILADTRYAEKVAEKK